MGVSNPFMGRSKSYMVLVSALPLLAVVAPEGEPTVVVGEAISASSRAFFCSSSTVLERRAARLAMDSTADGESESSARAALFAVGIIDNSAADHAAEADWERKLRRLLSSPTSWWQLFSKCLPSISSRPLLLAKRLVTQPLLLLLLLPPMASAAVLHWVKEVEDAGAKAAAAGIDAAKRAAAQAAKIQGLIRLVIMA